MSLPLIDGFFLGNKLFFCFVFSFVDSLLTICFSFFLGFGGGFKIFVNIFFLSSLSDNNGFLIGTIFNISDAR